MLKWYLQIEDTVRLITFWQLHTHWHESRQAEFFSW